MEQGGPASSIGSLSPQCGRPGHPSNPACLILWRLGLPAAVSAYILILFPDAWSLIVQTVINLCLLVGHWWSLVALRPTYSV